jgi:hypothetical protein
VRRGEGQPGPDVAAKAKLREQARAWLKAELAAWNKVLETGPDQAKALVVQTLQHWQKDADLAGIREPDVLAKLPEVERKEWRDLWVEVAELLKRAQGGRP